MHHLIPDVETYILETYAASHAPLNRLACRRWQQYILQFELKVAAQHADDEEEEPFLFVGVTPDQLARERYGYLLGWLISRTTTPVGSDTSETAADDKVRACGNLMDQRKALMGAAAYAGMEQVLKQCHHVWDRDCEGVLDNCAHRVITAAARGGHERIVRLCVMDWWPTICLSSYSGTNVVKDAMIAAARSGHEHIMRVCRDEWSMYGGEEVMAAAARGGRFKLVRLCRKEYGYINRFGLDVVMSAAARGGHEKIVRWCYERGARDVLTTMAEAARGGHEAIVRLCHDEWNATSVDWAMTSAAAGGHAHIVRLCHDEYKATDVNKAMRQAALYNREHIVRLCHDEYNATDVNGAMLLAGRRGFARIVRLCHDEYGASDIDELSRMSSHPSISKLCARWLQQQATAVLQKRV